METLKLKIKKLRPNAVIPAKKNKEDNGYDLVACHYEYNADIDCYIYYTGIAIANPIGYSGDVVPKSRHRKKCCYMPNTPGDIDPGYTGEIQVSYKPRLPRVIYNIIKAIIRVIPVDNHLKAQLEEEINAPYKVGDEIAQYYLTPHPDLEFEEVNELPKTSRGDGGHGSTEKPNNEE